MLNVARLNVKALKNQVDAESPDRREKRRSCDRNRPEGASAISECVNQNAITANAHTHTFPKLSSICVQVSAARRSFCPTSSPVTTRPCRTETRRPSRPYSSSSLPWKPSSRQRRTCRWDSSHDLSVGYCFYWSMAELYFSCQFCSSMNLHQHSGGKNKTLQKH